MKKTISLITGGILLVYAFLAFTGRLDFHAGRLREKFVPISQPQGNLQGNEKNSFQILTANSWRFLQGDGPFQEGYEYRLSSDGTAAWRAISDYQKTRTGLWNYKSDSEEDGFIFVLWSDSSTEVLYYKFGSDAQLLLAGDLLNAVTAEANESAALRSDLPDIINQRNFSDYFTLTSTVWTKTDTKDDTFVPDEYTFQADGTFLSRYRRGACEHSGHWSLKEAKLILEMPAHTCDQRGSRDSFKWVQSYELHNAELILEGQYTYLRS